MATIIANGSYSTNKSISPKKIFGKFSNYENSFRIISSYCLKVKKKSRRIIANLTEKSILMQILERLTISQTVIYTLINK